MTYVFRNPVNDYEEKYSTGWVFMWCFFFGSLFFLVRGLYSHAAISFVLMLCTAGLSGFVYPFFASSILRTSYLKKGYIQIEPVEVL